MVPKLYYKPIQHHTPLLYLDFTDSNNNDDLAVQDFTIKAQKYIDNNLATVWAVHNIDDRIIGFFTTSMTAIDIQDLDYHERVVYTSPRQYPAMLLGQMGVHKEFRSLGVGSMITHFCKGLAMDISKRIACRYLVLKTDHAHMDFYQRKCKFIPSIRADSQNLFWMYKRISLPPSNK